MNKIYKVMYSKVKQCAVVVSEIAKSHGHNEGRSAVRKHTALTAAVLIALGTFTFMGTPTAQAVDSLKNNDFVGANSTYWYWDTKTNTWKTYDYKLGDAFNNRAWGDLPNYNGAGAKLPGSIAAGLYAQAGQQTITIGDRNAGQSRGSVFIGEHSGYTNVGDSVPAGIHDNYVTAVGFQSGATGWGSIAIGSNAIAENTKKTDTTVNEVGEIGNPKTVSDDVYGIESNPSIEGASVALGYNAHAKDGNIAIGADSEATDTSSGTPYVSVGNSTLHLQRRITNVADGAAATDVATVGQLQALSKELGGYKAGFGIKIATDSTDKTKNTISLDRNLGTNYTDEEHKGDKKVTVKVDDTGLVLGGYAEDDYGNKNNPEVTYGATGDDSVTVGGKNGLASGKGSVAAGGVDNVASGVNATVIGGDYNDATGKWSAALGGRDNTASGEDSTATGGGYNVANGTQSAVLGGFSNYALGTGTTSIGGYGKDYQTGYDSSVNGIYSVGLAGGSTGKDAAYALAAGNQAVVTTENGTAIGYQATTDEAGTIAFGHDKGDVSGYTIEWNQLPKGQDNGDGTTNDYSKAPKSVTPTTYNEAAYNRLVKVADGKDAHDVVVMEQLNKAQNDLKVNAGWGINIEDVTTKDENGKEMTKKNVISLKRNLGKNYGNTYDGEIYGGKGKVTFEADGENSLILGGGAINNRFESKDKDFSYGAHAKDSVLVGGLNNSIEKQSEGAIIVGGTYNTASSANQVQYTGKDTIIVGGMWNKAEGNGALLIGGSDNQALSTGKVQQTGEDTIIIGGSSNKAEGDESVLIGGNNNEATGLNATIIGGSNNKNDGWDASIWGGYNNQITGIAQASGIFGGSNNKVVNNGFTYILGGENNSADGGLAVIVGGGSNKSSGLGSSVFGGADNTATGESSSIIGGLYNAATNYGDVISGGFGNLTSGEYAYAAGGTQNYVTNTEASSFGGKYSSVNGAFSTGVAGGSTGQEAFFSLSAGYQSVVTDGGVEKTYLTGEDANKVLNDMYSGKKLSGYYISDPSVESGPENPGRLIHYDKFSTALGYQATANKPGTISFGHDAGDESGYTYEWETLTDENGNPKQNEIDGTTNDYTKAPKSVKKKAPYTSAYYNRLVKVADGIDDHDVVVMEQLKQYAEKDASNLGNNIKVYKTDANGNVQLDKDKKPIEDTDATTTAQNGSKDDWGKALGAAPFTAGTTTTATNASISDQLVTGKTLYNYDKPNADGTYVKLNQTTGQNLSALDSQVAKNTTKLDDENHNIKYYSVKDKTPDDKLLPSIPGYLNDKNDGAKGAGSMAAGFNTHADGIASTVAGSYSGVVGTGLQGAAALSYGTVNVNQNTDPTKAYSGVANSIVGQANMTTNSNAAIIYGAGNTVTDSYRPIDKEKAKAILGSTSDPKALSKAMQDAVKDSGGQVMVMGGGNVVDNAYMSQVTGVGNTVKGNQVYAKNAKTGKWEWTTDTNKDTAIKGYDKDKSSQYNYVDGFNNEVINGKHDYVIGANNTVTGDSYDDKTAKKYSNESNIIFGDNHTVTNTKNAVIIGSSDTQMTLDKGDNATAIGHNASAQRDALAVGVNTEARGNAVALGTYSTAHNNSIAIGTKATAVSSQNLAIGWEAHIGNIKTDDEKIKNAIALGSDSQVKVNDLLESDNNRGVLSIGDKDKERRIIHVRAGVNDTDAVNVSQLRSVQSGLTDKGLTFVTNDGERTAKLGSKVTIQGTAKKDGHEYTADNLTTEIDGSGNITILMDKDMSTETLAVNGKDGKNGQPGTAGSIGINGQDGQSGVGIDGKDGISIKGKDGKDGVTIKAVDGQNGTEGHIGLTGPAGTNGKDGTNAIDITVKNGYDGANGINGKNGVDGTSLTRIVYTDNTGEHQVATMEDGLKFKGDGDTVIKKKLNNTMEIIGGAKGDLTEGNIGVNSTTDGKLKVQLAKDLTGITSIGNQTTGAKITFGSDGKTTITGGDVDVNGGKITNVGSGIKKDANGKYTVTDQNKGNAANIGDVQNMVNDAVNSATDTTNKALAGKANIDASNIGANLKGADGKAASTEKQKTNAENWGSAIGTGKIEANDGRMVTGETVYDEVRPKEDGNYVKKDKTTGDNLSALDSKIGKLDETKTYNYIDSKSTTSISDNLGKLDTQVKTNAENIENNTKSIQNITNNVKNLSDNAVQYDKDTNKTKVTLGGEGGTTITNVKEGVLSDKSTDAVNGKQLYAEQQARKELETKVTSNTTEINNIKDGKGFSDKGKEAIRDLAKGSVKVIAGTNTTVTPGTDKEDGAKTYAVNVEGKGNIASGDTGLISGDTLYKEVHVDKDGTYIKSQDSATDKDMTVAQNLSALDKGLKTTSDLIHTNDKGDIQIGGSSTATKIDVSGKDAKGNTTGRFITGVVTDAGDPTSAANVGYVNGVTAANTQQIYRDMNNAYGRLNNNINKAAAGSNALAALHPLDYDPDDKADFAVGYGHYRNANAAAVGAFYHPNENTMVNVGVSLGNGDPGFNAGVSFKIGSGSAGHQAMSKTEMAKVINSQSKEIDALKKDNADKDKRIDALEQKMAEILAKLDKNGK